MAKKKVIRKSNRPLNIYADGTWLKQSKTALGNAGGENLGNTLGAVGGGLSGILGAGTANAQIADTSDIQSNIDALGKFSYQGDNNSLLNQWGSRATIDEVKSNSLTASTGSQIKSTLGGIASGAAAGASVGGPIGAIVGGAAGLIGGVTGSIIGNRKAKEEAARLNKEAALADARNMANFGLAVRNNAAEESLLAAANYAADGGRIYIKPSKRGTFTKEAKSRGLGVQEFASKVLANPDDYSEAMRKKAQFAKNTSKWKHADGGPLFNEFSNGLVIISNGGTHEENPNEGIQVGIDPQGIPNLVEEGEVIFNDYVFSNRLFADGGLLESVNLPKSYDGYSFAAIAEKLGKESEERPNDPISKRGLMSSMTRLQQAQEIMRQKKESNKFAHGGKVNKFETRGQMVQGYKPKTSSVGNVFNIGYTYPEFGITGGPYIEVPSMNFNNMEQIAKLPSGAKAPSELPMASLPSPKEATIDYSRLTDPSTSKRFSVVNINQGQDNERDLTWLRHMPTIGSALGLGINLLDKPDYSRAEAVEAAANDLAGYDPVGFTPLGDYISYNPFDRNFYTNKANAQAGATRSAIMNTSSPSRNAALLAADYNAQGRLGDLARQAEEYNLAQRQAVAQFNRATNQANAEMGLKAAMANQEAYLKSRSGRLSGIAQAMQMKDAIDANRGTSISANMSNFFNSLGDIGREEYARNMIVSNPALYYSIDRATGKITYKNGFDGLTEAQKAEVRKAANKASNKKAKGGYLTIKRK